MVKRNSRKDPNWTNDQGVNAGLLIFRIIFWGAVALLIIATIIGVLVDLWRFWGGVLITVTSLWLMIRYLHSMRQRNDLIVFVLGVFAIASPYLVIQGFLFFGNVESSQILTGLDEGFGWFRCQGDYTWFDCEVAGPFDGR